MSLNGISYFQADSTKPQIVTKVTTYTIKSEPSTSKETGKTIYLLTANNAIRAVCDFAKIQNFSISDEVSNMPGKNIPRLTSNNLEVLFQLVEKAFGLSIQKTTFEDGTVFYEFDKKKK